MQAEGDPNVFWRSVLSRFADRTALVSIDGQTSSYARLDRAIANIADLLVDYGARPGSRIACTVPNFAVTVAFWFATWRVGGHVMTAPDPRQFVRFGLAPDLVIVPDGQTTPVGLAVPLHANALVDEPGLQVEVAAGRTYFNTANTPRDARAMAVGPDQLIGDARLYSDLLGPPKGGVYMTTGLSSLRAMRDLLRAFDAGVPVAGGDIAPDAAWPVIRRAGIRELMLSPLSLHEMLKHAQDADCAHSIDRVLVAAGTARPELLARAHGFFGDVIELGAGTNETSVYAWKKYDPSSYAPGQIGRTCCGIRAEIRDADNTALPYGEDGTLALWVPPGQRFEGYIGANPAYDAGGWVHPGFLARMSHEGEITKLGRTDDRINLGGTRMFSGKIEAQLERLASVNRAAAIRVYDADGAEALGIAVEPGPGFDADDLRASLKRALRGIGEIFVRTCDALPLGPQGHVDRPAVEALWPGLSDGHPPD